MKKFFALPLLFAVITGYSQGCSDAGFCTMGAMKPDQNYSKRINFRLRSVELNGYMGTTKVSPTIFALTADMNFGINDKSFFQIKVPYMAITGRLGSNHGIGDISLGFTQTVATTPKGSLNLTVGTKIPTNDSNKPTDKTEFGAAGEPAPRLHMYYQTSLGSFDFIAGASWINDKWLFATGVQIALTENGNEFTWSQYPNFPDPEYLTHYDVGNYLKRGTDVMLRIERNFRFTNYNFSIGVLPIYRITQDEIQIPNSEIRQRQPDGSGLALSAIASFGYNFNVNSGIKFIFGYKLTDREFNPDGLTREEVISTSYVYRF